MALTNAAMMLFGVATGVLSARLLDPNGRGEFLTWQTWALIGANLANFGYAQAIVTTIRHEGLPSRRELTMVAAFAAVLSSVITVGVFATLDAPLPGLVGSCLFAASNSISAILPAIAQRRQKMVVAYNVARLTPQVLSLIVLIILFTTGISTPGSVMMWIGGSQLIVTWLLWLMFLRGSDFSAMAKRRFIVEGIRLGPPGWSLYLFYQADLLAVTLLLPRTDVAFYGIATAAQAAVFSLGQSVAMRWFSARRSARTIPTKMLKQVLLVSVPASILVMVVSPFAIPLVYGENYSRAIASTLILSVGGVIRSFDNLLWHHQIGRASSSGLLAKRIVAVVLLFAAATAISISNVEYKLELFAAASVVAVAVGSVLLTLGPSQMGASSKAPRLSRSDS